MALTTGREPANATKRSETSIGSTALESTADAALTRDNTPYRAKSGKEGREAVYEGKKKSGTKEGRQERRGVEEILPLSPNNKDSEKIV